MPAFEKRQLFYGWRYGGKVKDKGLIPFSYGYL